MKSVQLYILSHDLVSGSDIMPCNKSINHKWFTGLVSLRNDVHLNVA